MEIGIFSLSACIVHTTAKHVISRHGMTRTSAKCTKMKSAHLKRAPMFFFFNMQICDILTFATVFGVLYCLPGF